METWRRNLYAMWFAQATGMSTLSFIMSFIPLYVVHLGVKNPAAAARWAGLLMGTSAFFATFSGPLWGSLADRIGRKPMVERVLISNSVITLLMAFAGNVYVFFFLRVIQGMLGGFYSAAIALVTSFTPPEKTGFALGLFQTAMTAGYTLGPLIGGVLADRVGFRNTFLIMACFSLTAFFIVHFLVRENFRPSSSHREPLLQSLRRTLQIPGLLPVLLVNFGVQFSLMAIGPIIPLFIKELGTGSSYLASFSGLVIAVGGLCGSLSALIAGNLSDRFPAKRVMAILATGGTVAFVLQGLARSPWQLLLFRGLTGLFMGGMIPAANTLINTMIPRDRKGSAFGLTTSFSLLGNVLGPVCGGLLSSLTGFRGVFLVIAALTATLSFWLHTAGRKVLPGRLPN